MEKKKLVKLLRKIIAEEVNKSVKKIRKEMKAEVSKQINEALQILEEGNVEDPLSETLRVLLPETSTEPHGKPAGSAITWNTGNSILNEILSKTKGGIPQTDTAGNPMPHHPIMDGAAAIANVPPEAKAQAMVEQGLDPTLAENLTKDYSKFMKVVDTKRGGG